MSGLYNQVAAGQRPESASSASPPSNHPAHFPPFPTTSGGPGMLVVPQPINASKVETQTSLSVFTISSSDGSDGRRARSGLLSSSCQRWSEEIPMQDVSPGKTPSAPLTLHRNIVLVMAGSEQGILYLRYSGSKRIFGQ